MCFYKAFYSKGIENKVISSRHLKKYLQNKPDIILIKLSLRFCLVWNILFCNGTHTDRCQAFYVFFAQVILHIWFNITVMYRLSVKAIYVEASNFFMNDINFILLLLISTAQHFLLNI